MSRGRRRWQPILELVLGGVVLVTTWIGIGAGGPNYPTWLSVGPVTLPTLVVPPTVLAVVVFSERLDRSSTASNHRRFREGIAGLSLLATGYAVFDLNHNHPGVFFAGFLPLFAGILLAISCLVSWTIDVVRRDR